MKIVAVFGDGSNQRALANRIHALVPISHVARIRLPRKDKRRLFRSLVSATLARPFRSAWLRMANHYETAFPSWPIDAVSDHRSSNDEQLIALIERMKPDLIVVSGTDLVKAATLERWGAPTMNLHTGISPYIRGGPNCTNWALALGEFDLIGNTVMWIDPGIDSGAIIATERTPLDGREDVLALHLKVMDHAHQLYRSAVAAYVAGGVRAIPQRDLAEGRLFLNKHWTAKALLKAAFNHRFRYRPFTPRDEIQLVALEKLSGVT